MWYTILLHYGHFFNCFWELSENFPLCGYATLENKFPLITHNPNVYHLFPLLLYFLILNLSSKSLQPHLPFISFHISLKWLIVLHINIQFAPFHHWANDMKVQLFSQNPTNFHLLLIFICWVNNKAIHRHAHMQTLSYQNLLVHIYRDILRIIVPRRFR